jgi:hypothetical protein
VTEKMGTLSVEKQEKLEHDVEKMEKKARKKEETAERQKQVSTPVSLSQRSDRGDSA